MGDPGPITLFYPKEGEAKVSQGFRDKVQMMFVCFFQKGKDKTIAREDCPLQHVIFCLLEFLIGTMLVTTSGNFSSTVFSYSLFNCRRLEERVNKKK